MGASPHVLWPPQGPMTAGPSQHLFLYTAHFAKTCPEGKSHGLAYYGHLWHPTHPGACCLTLAYYRTVVGNTKVHVETLCALCTPQTHLILPPYSSTVVLDVHLPHAPNLLLAHSILSLYTSCKHTESVGGAIGLAIRTSSRDGEPRGDGACGR